MASVVVNAYEAKTRLSQLIAQAEQGDDVTIARRGKPVVRLVPLTEPPQRELGFLGGVLSSESDNELLAPLDGEELSHWDVGDTL
ncbi:MAG: type II toxin-antitoxin system prevent-host-death family antitoxin [Micrococcales bacterium]|nr:type II toxin-antitoxin system prevent-host-death family antitoxin [Micrococcales bacterium]